MRLIGIACRPPIIIALLLALLVLITPAASAPAIAQPPAPTASPATAATPVPVATALVATPVSGQTPLPTAVAPTPRPTQTVEQLTGAENAINWWNDARAQLGLLGVLGLAVVFIAYRILSKLADEAGKKLSEYLVYVTFGRWLDRRTTTIKQREQFNEEQARQHEAEQRRQQALIAGRTAYLAWVQDELQYMPHIRMTVDPSKQPELSLRAVYVPMRVVERVQIEQFRRLMLGDFAPEEEYRLRDEAWKALEPSCAVYSLLSDPEPEPPPAGASPVRHEEASDELLVPPPLLLIGDAGSGKTTTLRYGALMLAHDKRANTTDLARRELGLRSAEPLLPFYIKLTLVADHIREIGERGHPDEKLRLQDSPCQCLLDWLDSILHSHLSKKHPTFPGDLPSQLIADGGCLLLLDSLDEVDSGLRDYIQGLIIDLVHDFPKNCYVVASRPVEGLRLSDAGFQERYLRPLIGNEARLLLHNWFSAALKVATPSPQLGERVDQQVAYIWSILEQSPRLFEMATNPLLLTGMALLVYHGRGLPRERAELYNRLVFLMLDTWRVDQMTKGIPMAEKNRPKLFQENVPSVQRRLQLLAAWMQEQQRREIRLPQIQKLLRPIYEKEMQWTAGQCDDYIDELMRLVSLHSGLIQRRENGYSFTHYTLQEYMAARAYDSRNDGVERLFERWQQTNWRETILLAIGHWATHSAADPEKARELLDRLLSVDRPAAVLLAADALYDAIARQVPELNRVRKQAIERLRMLSTDAEHYPDARMRERAAAMLEQLLAGGELSAEKP